MSHDDTPRFVHHGTAADRVGAIIERGLQPRRDTEASNWAEVDMESHPAHVYLTSLYALHYGVQATGEGEPFAVVEVDLARLDGESLFPDEDYLEEAARADEVEVDVPDRIRSQLPDALSEYRERTRVFRDHVDQFGSEWRASLRRFGTCAHRGPVPPAAIRRVATVDPSSEFRVAVEEVETGIRNVPVFGEKYRLLTEWVLGEDIPIDEYLNEAILFGEPSADRRDAARRIFEDTNCTVQDCPAYRNSTIHN